MQVTKVINNNIVSCMAEDGQECIAMGRGLGYRARVGQSLQEADVEKVFRMENQRDTDRLKDLLRTLPDEQLELCSRIISYANETLGRELNQNVYLTLTDHVNFTISRMRRGLCFQNALLAEVRTFYPREFDIGKYALALIAQELQVRLPEDEAASIALHLVNAEYDTSLSEMMHITQALHDILAMLDGWQGITLQPDSSYYDELTVHLKFLALRAFRGESESLAEPQLVQAIHNIYPQETACATAIAEYLENQSHHEVSPEKRAYLAIHLHRASIDVPVKQD